MDPRIDSYEWKRGREAMLRFGPDDGPLIIAALPLFEEANRTRAFVVTILRALAERGIGSVLPDLPGQGDSLLSTDEVRLSDLRSAFEAVPGTHAIAIRSGALLVGDRRPSWLLTPQEGSALVRELTRIAGRPLQGARFEVAGNMLSRELVEELATASHPGEGRDSVANSNVGNSHVANAPPLDPGLRRGRYRTVRLTRDRRFAHRHLAGEPLWRRSEPDNDLVLAQLLAGDIADWIATYAA